MKLRLIGFAAFLLFLYLITVTNSFAAALIVTKTADSADGVCDTDCSLREAIFAAANGDTIIFSALFNSPQTITLVAGHLPINKNLTFAGNGADLLTVSGNNTNRIFYISGNSTVAISGMKLASGKANVENAAFGGAIYLIDSTLTLTNTILSNNTARFNDHSFGGAIYSLNSTLSIINSIVSSNDSPRGGGIFSENGIVNISNSKVINNTGTGVSGGSLGTAGAQINIFNSTFSGNSGGVSGSGERISISNSVITNNELGVFSGYSDSWLTIDRSIISNHSTGIANQGTATISNTLITNNRNNNVYANGGGIVNGGTLHIVSSSIINNWARESGGGIYNPQGRLFLTNSTVSGNVTDSGGGANTSRGGGIYVGSIFSSEIILTNSTVANNRSTGIGGGIYHDNSGRITIRNSIIAQNTSNTKEVDISGIFISQGFNIIGNTTGNAGWIATDLINRNPLLAPLGNNGGLTPTHALLPGSPAIDAGNVALAKDPTTGLELLRDQRGSVRTYTPGGFSKVDIGAYELYLPASSATISGTVLTVDGRGIDKARITLTDASGTAIYAQTNPFGYYRFKNLPSGTNYTITVSHKHYRFNSPQSMMVDIDRNDLDFVPF